MELLDKPTVQDIFLRFYPGYLEKYSPSPVQSKVANCIINCKTGAYGANISICEDCGHTQIHYNSCRNRCCPMCQALPKEMWMDKRREDVLDAPYFHVVFTVPQELNPLIYSNQQLLYDTLYHSVSATINELTADTKHLGAKVGYICVLHTWGSEMNFHPHIHVILLGGGLTAKNQWRDKGEEFFLPVKVLSKLFRGKYLNELKILWEENKLQFHGSSVKYRNHYAFKELLNTCYEKDWIGWLKSRNECCSLSIGLYIVLAPLYLKSVRKLQEKRIVFVKILAIIIPENGAKVSKIKCLQPNQQTLLIRQI